VLDVSLTVGFEWDEGNARKSVDRHGVVQAEAEAIFLQGRLLTVDYPAQSLAERRFCALGRTPEGRMLHARLPCAGAGRCCG